MKLKGLNTLILLTDASYIWSILSPVSLRISLNQSVSPPPPLPLPFCFSPSLSLFPSLSLSLSRFGADLISDMHLGSILNSFY